MNLIIDIGNSRVKVAVVESGRVVAEFVATKLEELPLREIADKYNVERSILSSTRADGFESARYVESVVGHCLHFDSSVAVPISIEYRTPHTLGRDRVAAAVGAVAEHADRNIMIVDFGTAITIDFVSSGGSYLGGFISPGVATRLRALHEFTSSLPLCSPCEPTLGIATSTDEAISWGVMNGVKFEIEGYIDQYSKKMCNLFTIFSGGDSIFFDKQIKNAIFADRDLVIKGLDRILDYNA